MDATGGTGRWVARTTGLHGTMGCAEQRARAPRPRTDRSSPDTVWDSPLAQYKPLAAEYDLRFSCADTSYTEHIANPTQYRDANAMQEPGKHHTMEGEPMKSMRLAKRAVTEPGALREIVEACRTVRLGAVDDEGMFIVPVSFGYDWELDEVGTPHLTLWLHSAGEGRKATAFAAHGADGVEVTIEMDCEDGVITGDYACAYSFAYRSIIGAGRIFPVSNRDEKARGLARIMAHMAPDAPGTFPDTALDRVAVWRIEVDHFTGKQRQPK